MATIKSKAQAHKGAPRAEWAKRITTAWQKALSSIIETGQLLIDAKIALGHGNFGKMIEAELPFKERTAQCLMKIARDKRLTNPQHVALLPPSWGTLYALTLLNDKQWKKGVEQEIIKPEMERNDVVALLHGPKPKRSREATEAVVYVDDEALAKHDKPDPACHDPARTMELLYPEQPAFHKALPVLLEPHRIIDMDQWQAHYVDYEDERKIVKAVSVEDRPFGYGTEVFVYGWDGKKFSPGSAKLFFEILADMPVTRTNWKAWRNPCELVRGKAVPASWRK